MCDQNGTHNGQRIQRNMKNKVRCTKKGPSTLAFDQLLSHCTKFNVPHTRYHIIHYPSGDSTNRDYLYGGVLKRLEILPSPPPQSWYNIGQFLKAKAMKLSLNNCSKAPVNTKLEFHVQTLINITEEYVVRRNHVRVHEYGWFS
jgi:hypothetical protein